MALFRASSGRRLGRIPRLAVVLGLLGASALAFQNCSEPSSDEGEEVKASTTEKTAFAYDAVFDTIGYMSCDDLQPGNFDASAYFTFRAGAYTSGGLRVKTDYFNGKEKELTDDSGRITYVTSSSTNTKTQMQLAIRTLANFQGVFTHSGTAQPNVDYQMFMPELGTVDMTTPLIKNIPSQQRIRYMRNGLVTGDRFEGSLHFGDSVELGDSLRQMLSAEGMLALTYSNLEGQLKTEARSPADFFEGAPDPKQAVYGKGLIVRFRQPTPPTGTVQGLISNYALREATEINLEDRNNTTNISAWSCPISLQFRIVRPEDLDIPEARCNAAPDPASLSADLAIARRVLRVEDWYIDMANRCIVTKKYQGKGCYGSAQTVQYDLSKTCTPGSSTEQCLHIASLCYRQGP